MNPNDERLYKQRHRCTVIYGWLQMIAYFLSFWAVGLMLYIYIIWPNDGVEYAEWAPMIGWWLLAVAFIVDVIAWLYWKHLINQGANTRNAEPYKVELEFANRDALYRQISEHIELQVLFPNVMYGNECGRRNIRLFVIDMLEYHKQSYKRIKSKAVQSAVKNHGMETQLSRQQMYKAIRLNLLLVENFTEEAYKSAEVNANYGMQYAEAVLNVVIDLTEMVLFIPAYRGTWYGGSAKYCACVKQLLKWLNANSK